MNILLITDDYGPLSKKVGAKMLHELACEFIKQGNHVTCIAPTTAHEDTSVTMDGVAVFRFYTGAHKNTGYCRRLLNELRFSKKIWQMVRKNPEIQPDLVVYNSPPIFFGKVIKKIKRQFGISSYLILRDFFPQWVIDQGMIGQKSLSARFLRYYEQISYQAATYVGVMSPENLAWFNDYTKNAYYNSAHVLHNWADPDSLTKIEQNNDFRKKYNLERKIIFIYGGNIGHAQSMENIVTLAKNLQNTTNAFFVIIGQGDEYDLVEALIKKFGLKNILLLPGVSQKDYFAIQKIADIGLFSLHKNLKTHNFPGKLLGYMAQGMPILGSVNSGNDLRDTVNDAGAGYVTLTGDDTALYQNALLLVSENEKRVEMGKNSLKLLEDKFSVINAARTILSSLDLTKNLTEPNG